MNISEDLGISASATQNFTLALGQKLFLLLFHPVVWCMMMETILFCNRKSVLYYIKLERSFKIQQWTKQ